jgi:cysteine-rich repeat protein
MTLLISPCWETVGALGALLEQNGPAPLCGDGVRTGSEECDDDNGFDDDCCSADCLFRPANPRCHVAVDLDPSSQFAGPFANLVAGWEFTALSRLTVVGLGVYDRDMDGFIDVHEIGLWRASGELEASALMPTLTIGRLAGTFRYVAIDPVVLVAGQRYVVAALYHQNVIEWVAENGDIAFDPRIAFETGREQYQVAGLQLPSETDENPRFGPSLLLVGQCGDGVVDGGEECDDGNATDGDGCSIACVSDTPTPTASASPTLTLPPSATPTDTAEPTPTVTHTATSASPSVAPTTPSVSTSPTQTATPNPSSSPTATERSTPTATQTLGPAPLCAGDCNGDGFVRIDELVLAVNIALERATLDACARGDLDGNGRISVDELVTSVNHTLRGCPPT